MLARTAVLCFVCLVATLALYGFAPPRPRVDGLTATFAIAPDSTVTATAQVTVRGTMQAGDQIRYKFLKDGVVAVNIARPELTYTASLPAPAYGATSCYVAAARVVYANGTQSPEKASGQWCYTRPGLPPAEIDTVILVTPEQAMLGPGGSQQFSATVGTSPR